MANQFDDRIVSVTIEIDDFSKTYSTPFTIHAYGMKYANDLQSECDIIIENIDRETRDYLLTAVSPFNKNFSPKKVTVSAGRESYGTNVIFVGNIVTASISQPPDIALSMKCLTGNYLKGLAVVRTQAGNVPLETVAKSIANDLGVSLEFQATNINIPNYNFSGGCLDQVTKITQYGNINAFLDGGILVVKDGAVALTGVVTSVSKKTGMIGIPSFTEQGLKVTFLIDPKTRLGGYLDVVSEMYPSMTGRYIIYKLGFAIESRGNPFFYIAECMREGYQY